MPASRDSTDRSAWPEPPEPSVRARTIVWAIVVVILTGITFYGTATGDPESGTFWLILGAAVVALVLAIREVVTLVRRMRRDE